MQKGEIIALIAPILGRRHLNAKVNDLLSRISMS